MGMWKSDWVFDPLDSDAEDDPQVDSERVMKDIQKLYLVREIGLRDAAKWISVDGSFKVVMPRQKITVLIVGHHNQAKQKFLDLYFNESRQNGYMARINYDKLDKIFITHGTQRRWLSGETVLEYCPHLAQLKNVPGLKDYLTTEIATRKTKSLVSFILAPESVLEEQMEIDEVEDNGNIVKRRRPFNIDKAISTLAEAADLIFIFFDPTGIIHPKVTLQPFEAVWNNHYEKLHLLLAKAEPDECSEETRENTLATIVREIWRNPAVRKAGYLPEIYCPDLSANMRDDERLWSVIQDATDKSVERALDQLERDALRVKDRLINEMAKNKMAKEKIGAPSSLFMWFVVFMLLLISIWVTQINEILCKAHGQSFGVICGEVLSNKAIVISIGLISIFYVIRAVILDGEPAVLNAAQEDLLNKRIQFAHHALYEKERMEKLYSGGTAYQSNEI